MSPNTAIKIVIKSQERRTKEERKEKGPQKSKTIKNIAVKTHINNYFKCKQIKHSNRITQRDSMGTKSRPIYMLFPKENLGKLKSYQTSFLTTMLED